MSLERTVVVYTALLLLNEVGLDGLTMRRLAERLNVQNPALYWHFKNKQELLNQMATLMLADAFSGLRPPASDEDWAEWLANVAGRFHQVLLSYRDGAQLVANADLIGSEMFGVLDLALRVLKQAGFDLRLAFGGLATLLDYTLSAAFRDPAEPSNTSTGSNEKSGTLKANIDPERFPTLAAALHEVADTATGGHTIGVEMGVQLILTGMRAAKQSTDTLAIH
jgi:TetR/AcrR family tetracycline transcriptional repressor